MPFVTEYLGEASARLVLSGHAGVGEAAALAVALRELAGLDGRVVVDESRLASFDASLVQLLVAFSRARRAAGRPMAVVAGPVARRLSQLGLAAELSSAE